MMFTNEVMKVFGMKWYRIKGCISGVLKYDRQTYGSDYENSGEYFYFFLNEDNTELHVGFCDKMHYDEGAYDAANGARINEIVIKNDKLPTMLGKTKFYEALYKKYMALYENFYRSFVEGDMSEGIISVCGRHYHYLSLEKTTGKYDYYIEEIEQPCKPYIPLTNTGRKLHMLLFTNEYMERLY
ncbi:MAG: hypothetical protein J6L77_07340 [Coprococcus sp.]|nr:hypothetical protein [Coprococcus sp.]